MYGAYAEVSRQAFSLRLPAAVCLLRTGNVLILPFQDQLQSRKSLASRWE